MSSYLDYNFEDSPETLRTFDELPIWSAHFGLLMLKQINLRSGIILLDIGSGAGFPLIEIAEKLGNGSKCYGIDPWKNANARALEKIQHYGLTNVEIVEGIAEAMPFEDNYFDMIVSNLGIHNIDHPEKAISECHRVLKPGGQIVLTTNMYGQWRTFYQIFEETLEELNHHDLIPILNKHEEARGTMESVVNLLHDAHFTLDTGFSESFYMRYLNGTAFLNHHFIKMGFLGTWKGLIPESDWASVFGRLEQNLNAYAEEYGELKMEVPMLYLEAQKY